MFGFCVYLGSAEAVGEVGGWTGEGGLIMCTYTSLREVFSGQLWWADVMFGLWS